MQPDPYAGSEGSYYNNTTPRHDEQQQQQQQQQSPYPSSEQPTAPAIEKQQTAAPPSYNDATNNNLMQPQAQQQQQQPYHEPTTQPQPYHEPTTQPQPTGIDNTGDVVLELQPLTTPPTTTLPPGIFHTDQPHYQPIPGVVDLWYDKIPFHNSQDRLVLVDTAPPHQDKESFEKERDANSCCSCADGCMLVLGPLSLGLLAVGGFLAVLGIYNMTAFFGIVGLLALITYLCKYVFCTYLCCTALCCCCPSGVESDQSCMSTPYYSSLYRPTDHGGLVTMINTISQDIPTVQFHVKCSHTTGSGKNRRTVVTYDKVHIFPIVSYRWAGLDAEAYSKYLDYCTSGDLSIRPKPEYHFLGPEGQGMVSKLRDLVYQKNSHRDVRCFVSAKFITYNPNHDPKAAARKDQPPTGSYHEEITFPVPPQVDQVDQVAPPGDQPQDAPQQDAINVELFTSVGLESQTYNNGLKTSDCATKCCTSRAWWCTSFFCCLGAFSLCAWHNRFSSLWYRSIFYVQMPPYNEIEAAYSADVEKFEWVYDEKSKLPIKIQ